MLNVRFYTIENTFLFCHRSVTQRHSKFASNERVGLKKHLTAHFIILKIDKIPHCFNVLYLNLFHCVTRCSLNLNGTSP